MQNNQLTEFNEGGSHEQNPFGGVPLGENASVEQGETKNGKYVYSDRISIDENMAKEMNLPSYIKGKTFADASKAINNKFLDRDDNYSNETKKTLLKRLETAQETIKAKDEARAQQIAKSMQANSQEIPDMMNGQIPEGMEEYTEPQNNPQEEQLEQPQMAYGGRIKMAGGGLPPEEDPLSTLSSVSSLIPAGINTFKPTLPPASLPTSSMLKGSSIATTKIPGAGPGVAGYLGAAQGAMSLFDLSKGNGASKNKLGSAASGALTGAQAGMAFGPIGAGVGAVVGIGAGLLGANKAAEAESNRQRLLAGNYSNQFKDTQMAYGGRIKMAEGGPYTVSGKPLIMKNDGMTSAYERFNPVYGQTFPEEISPLTKNTKGLAPYATPSTFSTTPTIQRNPEQLAKDRQVLKLSNVLNQNPVKDSFITDKGLPGTWTGRQLKSVNKGAVATGNYLDKNGGKFLKYAPVAMNAYQLATLSKPENKILQRLSNRYVPSYTDEAKLQNIADQEMNNSVDAYSQLGGSQGAVRNAIIASGLNKTKGLSDAYIKSNEYNNTQNEKAQEFNSRIDEFNTRTSHTESDNWERNKAAYDTEKSKLLGDIGNNLGNISKEEINKNQIASALGYDVDGEYVVNKKTGEKTLATDFYKNIEAKSKKEYKFKSGETKPLDLRTSPIKYNFK